MTFSRAKFALWLFLLAAVPALAQTNDHFAGRLTLTGPAAATVSCNLRATREPGEPNHAATPGARSLWWTWTAPASGVVNFSTFGGGTSPSRAGTNAAARSLAIYTGDSLAALSEVASATTLGRAATLYPQTSGVPAGPSLNVPVVAGTAYQIAVDGAAVQDASDDGTVVLSVNQAPAIFSPAGASGTVGAGFTYTIQASNNPTGFVAANLPAGLSINPYTGIITGVPQAAGTTAVSLRATNPGGTGMATLTLNVGNAQASVAVAAPSAPVFSSSAAASGTVGTAFSYSLYASDHAANFTASGLPGGLTLDVTNGRISGTPTAAGVFTVPVTATNAVGTGHATISFNIAAAPLLPAITSSLAAGGTVGTSFYYSISTTDQSGAAKPTSYGATSLPPGLGIDTTSGSVQGTPSAAGIYTVPISATNATGTGNAVLTITVAPASSPISQANAAPLLTSSAVATGAVGTGFSYGLAATNSPTGYTADNLPPGLGINAQTGYITGSPANTGVFLVPVTASNAYGTCQATLTLAISAPVTSSSPVLFYTGSIPATPIISSAAAAGGYVGQSISYQILPAYYSYYGFSGTPVYAASNLPPGLSINATYGYISGTPTAAGTYSVPVSLSLPYTAYLSTGPATQYVKGSAVVTFVIGASVPPVSAAPVVSSAATSTSAVVGSTFSGYTISASNSPTGYTADNLPPGLSVNTSTGAISGTPTAAGTYAAAISATNSIGTGHATVTFTVAANATSTAPTAPVISSSAVASATVGSSFSYSIYASNSPTSYMAGSLPPGLAFSSSVITGMPTSAGVYQVPISATNAAGTSNATLTITVAPQPAPQVSGYATVRGVIGSSLSYSISGTNSPTGYTADNLPPGLRLAASGGTISGTPTAAGTFAVPVSATNAAGTGSATVTFTIAANAGPPVLSGAAVAKGTVGTAFSYTLSASNSPMGYTADSLPPGLSLAASGGTISGTPTAAGVYAVPVSATNAAGTANATLTITIAASVSAVSTPVVISAAAAPGIVGISFSYTILASGSPTSFDLGATPPSGLSFNPSTGILSGTPTSAGTFVVPVTATNASGTGRAKITLVIASGPPAAPVITSAAGATAYLGEPFSYAITGTNNPASYTASTLPSGLTLNATTGVISGTPTGGSTISNVTLTAGNAIGTGTATLTLQTGTAPGRFTSPLSANGVKGTALVYASATNASVYSYSASSLPTGLSINSSTGRISGSPTASGTFNTVITASSSSVGTFYANVTFVIAATAAAAPFPVLSSNAGANGTMGSPFSYTLTASNSPTGLKANSLPAGLTFIASTGLISGTPTTYGSFLVSVGAVNSAGTTNGTLRLYIAHNDPPRFTSPAGAQAVVGTTFSYAATNNTGYTNSFYASNLPPGLTYDYYAATISGTPTMTGTYTVPISAYTSTGTISASVNITVAAAATAPALATSAAGTTGAVGAVFGYTLTASTQVTGYTASGLPAGVEFDPATGRFSGRPTAAGTFYVPVTVTNAVGTTSATLTFAIAAVPPPPALDATSLTAAASVGAFTVLSPIQASNTPTRYTASGLPPGLSVDPVSGAISGTPTTAGLYPVTVSAANAGGSADAVVTFTVSQGTAPLFSYQSATWSGSVGKSFSQSLSANNSPTSYAASGLPPGLYLSSSTGQVLGVPTAAGSYPVSVTAVNAAGSDSETLTLLIAPGIAPTISSGNAAAAGLVGGSFSYSFYANNSVTCTVSGLPPGLNYSVSSGTSGSIQGTPTTAGVYAATLNAINAAGTSSAVVTITITGAPALAPPVVSSAAAAGGYVGTGFGYAIYASNSPTGYTASGLPDGLQLNAATGYISGTPTAAGSYPVNVSASSAGGTGNAVITLEISGGAPPPPAAAPVISSPAATNFPGTSDPFAYLLYSSVTPGFSYTITADGNPTSYGASNLPPGLSLNLYTGVISGTPLTAGTFTVPISATNSAGTGTAVLTIIATATPPALTPTLTASGAVGSGFGYAISQYADSVFNYYPFTGVVRETTTYAATGLAPGLSLNPATGIITGTPTQGGSFPVALAATNRAGTSRAVVTFVIADAPPALSTPPVFVGGNATAPGIVGSALSYTLFASNAASFAASGLPDGLSLDPVTGKIGGTPTMAGIYTVPVSATNAPGTAHATLTFAIAAAPLTPIVSSAAGARATAGMAFGYSIYIASNANTPAASAYGADNLPAGLNLDPGTGRITGTPTAAGDFTIPISAVSVGTTGRATLTLTVLPAPSNPSPPATAGAPVFTGLAGTVGFTANPFVHMLGAGGFAPDGALPDGLSYDAASGMISGYPGVTGSFDVPLSATGTGGTGHAVLNLRLAAPDLSLPRITLDPHGQTVAQGGSTTLAAAVLGVPAPSFQWMHDGAPVPNAVGPELDFQSAQPADAGTYFLRAGNPSGTVTSAPAILTVTQTYEGWQGANFSADEIAAGLAAGSYDFNGDGLPNLLEYALGRDPRTGLGGNLPTVLKPTGGALQIQFTRDSSKTDLAYIVEASSDLRAWTAIAASMSGGPMNSLGGAGVVTESAAGGSLETVTVQAGQVAGTGGTRFLRLRVTSPTK